MLHRSFFALAWAVCCAGGGYAQTLGFTANTAIPTQNGPLALATADFNGDGKPDFAVANASAGTISIYLGNGDGTFQTLTPFTVTSGCTPNYVAVADFNNDNKTDLLLNCGFTGSIAVVPGNGDGTFGKAVVTILPAVVFAGNFLQASLNAAIADFDKDGNLDVVVSAGDISKNLFTAQGYLLRGVGDGSFHAAQIIPLPLASLSFAAGDWNGDGNPDLAVLLVSIAGAQTTTAAVYTALGDGKGNFTAFTSHANGVGLIPTGLIAADVNGDGKTDLVLTGPSVDSMGDLVTFGVEVFVGDGLGGFKQEFVSLGTTGNYAFGAALADLRGTGKPDLVEAAVHISGQQVSAGSIAVFENNGDGTFAAAQDFPVPTGTLPFALASADVNGDGQADLALVSIDAAGLLDISGRSAPKFPSLPAGDFDLLINTTKPPLTFSDVNAASFLGGNLAVDSIATAFGSGFGPTTAVYGVLPLTTTLGGVTVNVRDSAGTGRLAPLFYVSSKQINFAVPQGTAAGAATVSVTYNGLVYDAAQQIAQVAPGVFAAQGLAAGSVLNIHNGVQTLTALITTNSAGGLIPVPINVGSGSDQVFLELYGTGIRHHQTPVTATIGGETLTATYADTQGFYVGEDQINFFLPQDLKGAGLVGVTLTVDGLTANTVMIQIQ
jgi:uncharacterized protein (TIGR03437 family)